MGSWKRQLHLLHRWLGIGVGLLVLLWFGSGVVMMYVPYPALTQQERMQWLAPLDADAIDHGAWDAWLATGQPGVPDEVRLNTVAGRPVYHFLAAGRWRSVRADDGTLLAVTAALAEAGALPAAPGAGKPSAALVETDQWSFGRLNAYRPLYRIDAGDPAGSVLYVSSRTGELVRDTTRAERAWNWTGSVLHWIYFTPLRSHNEPWRQVVMWSSAAALLLVVLGMVLGLQRLRLRRRYKGGRRSPYRGWQGWHHWLGLGMGTLTITWLLSGWLSVTPFGWLASPGITDGDKLAFAGGALSRGDLSVAAADLARMHPGVLELEWRRVDGKLYLSALDRQQRRLLDAADGRAVSMLPEAVVRHAVQAARPGAALAAVELLAGADAYYYSHHQTAAFPVLRVRFRLDDGATFYADPVEGRLVAYADRNSRWNRWLFNGMHQLDFAAMVRARPAWDVMVATLCALGAALATTGVVLGWRRLSRGGVIRRYDE